MSPVESAPPLHHGGRRAFWTVAGTLTLFTFGASAPSPLYVVYQHRFHFSSTTLTAIFAIYAFTLLATLLPAGSLSDRAGRRPVVLGALVVQAGSVTLFLLAHGVALLFAARAVQGVATGAATATLSAGLVDLQPEGSSLGALTAAVAPSVGLASGALAAGALVQLAPAPLRLIFWAQLAALAFTAVLITTVVPETVRRQPIRRRDLRVRVHVPRQAAGAFVALVPGMIATWGLAGLYFSLGASLAGVLLSSSSHVVGGLVPATLSVAMGVGSVATRNARARPAVIGGTLVLAAGVAVTLVGIRADSAVPLFLGSAIAGAGFGPVFAGTFRTLAPLAPVAARGELLAAVYVVSYLAYSIPAVLAGLAVTHWGLRDGASGYAIAMIALALAAAAATYRRR